MVTYGPRRSNTCELRKSLLITGRKQGHQPGRDFVHPQVGASLAQRSRTNAGSRRSRVLGAAQHEVMRCRPGTVPVRGGPGSAVHRFADARAAPRPGHAMASDCSRHALAGPIPVFSCFSPDSDSSIPGLTISSTHTSSFPRCISAPGGLHRCFTHPESRGGRSAEKRSGAQRNTRGAYHDAIRQAPSEAPCVPWRVKTRVNALMTRDARLSALHRGGFGLPGPRFSHRHWRRIGYSELLAPRS